MTTSTVERAEVYEGSQIGIESVAGTAVAANKRLLGTSFVVSNNYVINPYKPQGNKFITTSQNGKPWSEVAVSGILNFLDLIYLANMWITQVTPSTPANNSAFDFTGATGTIGFTYKGVTLAPASYGSAAAFQTAIEGMSSVLPGNVKVTSSGSGQYTVKFIGALGNDTTVPTSITGTPLATMAPNATATLTRRWRFVMAPSGPDSVATATLETGSQGVANYAQQAAFMFLSGLSMKVTKSEASLSGTAMAQATVDPFTMTASPTDVQCVPMNMKDFNLFTGDSYASCTKQLRAFECEVGIANRAGGLFTLNADDPSFSNRIEESSDNTASMTLEHDAAGSLMIQKLRSGTPQYFILENRGPLIETGFYYKMRVISCLKPLKDDNATVDNAVAKKFDTQMQYASDLGTGFILEIDAPLSAL